MIGARTIALVVAGAVVLGGLSALDAFNGILRGMHVPGAGAYGFGDPAQLGRVPSSAARDASKDVLRTWQEHDEEVKALSVASPERIVELFFVVDFFLVAPGLLVLLLLAAWRVHEGIAAVERDEVALNEIAMRRLARRGVSGGNLVAERSNVRTLLHFHATLAYWAGAAAVLYFFADEVENVVTRKLVDGGVDANNFGFLFVVLSLAAKAKYLFFVLAAVGIAAAALSLAGYRAGALRRFLAAATILRLQIAVALLFAVFVLGADQISDTVRRWIDDGEHDGSAAVIAVLALSFVLIATARRLLDLLLFDRVGPERWWSWVAVGAVLGVVGGICDVALDAGEGVWAIGGLIALIGVLSFRSLPPDPVRRDLGGSARWLPALIAAVPPAALGCAAMQAGIAEAVYRDDDRYERLVWGGPLLVAVAVVVLIGALMVRRIPVLELAIVGTAAALGVLFAILVVLNPWRTGELVGSVAVFATFLVFALVLGSALLFYAEHVRPLSFFTALRLRRTPVVSLLILAAVLAASVDRDGAYYDTRLDRPTQEARALLAEPAGRSSVTRETLFDEWTARADPWRDAVPIVFVAAAGGGIRAAYWVATVLDCIVEGGSGCRTLDSEEQKKRRAALFALSGISGGSLGLAAFAGRAEDDEKADWVDERLDDDYLAPVIAWTLFVDLPTAFIRRDGGTDRAEVLERAWERSWLDALPDQDPWSWDEGDTEKTPLAQRVFDRFADDETRLPLLLLNGTKVQDGCRMNLSGLRAAPEFAVPRTAAESTFSRLAEDCLALRLFERPSAADVAGGRDVYVEPDARSQWSFGSTEDLANFVCNRDGYQDLRLSSAVLLSARFPYVSPSGRLRGCRSAKRPAINVVDGGYFDTSGASPVVELWHELASAVDAWNAGALADVQGEQEQRPCLVPVFLQIDTGYADPVGLGTERPLETQVPVQALGSARNAREANARQAAALAFSGPLGGLTASAPGGTDFDRYAHLYPRAHPGARAPLGWTLSEAAQDDLQDQLRANREELAKIERWFDDELACSMGGR